MKSNIIVFKGKPSPFDFYMTPQGNLKQVVSVRFKNEVTIPEMDQTSQIYVIDDTLFVFTSKHYFDEEGNIDFETNRATVEDDIIIIT